MVSCISYEEIIALFFGKVIFHHFVLIGIFPVRFLLTDPLGNAFLGIVGFEKVKIVVLRLNAVKGIGVGAVERLPVLGVDPIPALWNIVLQHHRRNRYTSVPIFPTDLI